MNDFVDDHFRRHPLKSVDPVSLTIPDDVILDIVRNSKFISVGRVETKGDYLNEFQAGAAEGPHRIILSLKMLAMGSALADQRTIVTAQDDLPMIRHIAFSTIPEKRRRLLQALLLKGRSLSSTDAATALRTSKPTALEWMEELTATGIVKINRGNSAVPCTITLADEWLWLIP